MCIYYIQNTPLAVVTHYKYLGVCIQSDLQWNLHINQITTKANHTLSLLQRNIKLASKKTKELVYTVNHLLDPNLSMLQQFGHPGKMYL